jgi:hypothetical protein
MISDRYGAKEVRDFFYIGAVGVSFLTLGYYYYLQRTKGWFDWGQEKTYAAYESVTDTVNGIKEWWYAERPEGDKEAQEGYLWSAIEAVGGRLGYTPEEMGGMYENLSESLFGKVPTEEEVQEKEEQARRSIGSKEEQTEWRLWDYFNWGNKHSGEA